MDSSLTVTTGSALRSEKGALTSGKGRGPLHGGVGGLVGLDRDTCFVDEGLSGLAFDGGVTVAASARSLTAAITWSRVMPATGVPATVVPGRARPNELATYTMPAQTDEEDEGGAHNADRPSGFHG